MHVGLHVNFADWAHWNGTIVIIPPVSTTRPDIHARLILLVVIRLSREPVAVTHQGHELTASITGGCLFPDEYWPATTWVDTLSSRRKVRVGRGPIASFQIGNWNIAQRIDTAYYVDINVVLVSTE